MISTIFISMKFLAFIFAFHLCAITAEPMLIQALDKAMHSKSCCERRCCTDKQNSCPINCPNGMCKVSFGSVGVYTIAKTLKLKLFSNPQSSPLASVDHTLLSDYLADCFHPPELA
jgi:hypothetical protein